MRKEKQSRVYRRFFKDPEFPVYVLVRRRGLVQFMSKMAPTRHKVPFPNCPKGGKPSWKSERIISPPRGPGPGARVWAWTCAAFFLRI